MIFFSQTPVAAQNKQQKRDSRQANNATMRDKQAKAACNDHTQGNKQKYEIVYVWPSLGQEHVYDSFNANSEKAGGVMELINAILAGEKARRQTRLLPESAKKHSSGEEDPLEN